MLSNCQNCTYHTAPLHGTDIGCAVNPSYWTMCNRLQDLAEAERQHLPIDGCNDFEAKLPYSLDDGCIRQGVDGQWGLLNRIRKGWGETAIFYPSLAALLGTERLSITGSASDAAGEFFTITALSPLPSAVAHTTPNAAHFIFMTLVESSNVDASGFDSETEALYVQFINGTCYRYRSVPQAIYERFCLAPSKGQFLNQVIKLNYQSQRLAL